MALPRQIGFIGTGAITDAIVRGLLAEPAAVSRVMVSLRSADISAGLAEAFPVVQVSDDNQAIVDDCDTVVLAIRPQIAEDVVRPLRFREGQRVISLVAATSRSMLLDWIGTEVHLTQAIPLPFVSERKGVTAVYPPDPDTAALFDALGSAVECDTNEEYDVLAASSSLMATYFAFLGDAEGWMVEQGIPADKAHAYLAPLFSQLADVACRQEGENLGQLSRAFATKGGLNEQVALDFRSKGGHDALRAALDRVLQRIRG